MRISGFSFLFSAIAVFRKMPLDKYAENAAIAGEVKKKQKFSLLSKDKVDKHVHGHQQHLAICV